MTEVPPSRWKVVERGRRLEVIDTRPEGAARPARGAGPQGGTARPGLPRRLRFDGTLGWTTHSFYDDRGPRAVVLDGGLARFIGGVMATLVAAMVLAIAVVGISALPLLGAAAVFVGSSWKQVRPWLTRRLDRIAV